MVSGSWYLIDAKWHAEPLPASEIYTFKCKVDGKLAGTKGFFVSWSGFSDERPDALRMGKELNVMLCDADDVRYGDQNGWRELLDEKVMYAALFGEIYLTRSLENASKKQATTSVPVEIFVEGNSDKEVLDLIIDRLDPIKQYALIPCSGKVSAIRLASTLPKRAIWVDGDGNPNIVEELKVYPLIDKVIAIEPQHEAVFRPKSKNPKGDLICEYGSRRLPYKQIVDKEIDQILKNDPQGVISKLKALLTET